MSSDRYETIRVAGRGAFGTVVVAKDLFTHKRVAIKRISVVGASKIQVVRELSALRCLHHPNVLKYVDSFTQNDILAIVTEEVPYTLGHVINDKRRPKNDDIIRWFHSQLLAGIAHIHSKDIMHRDIKPENILVTSSNIIKIADFGQACIYQRNNPDEEYDINVATRWYRAPEILFGSRKYGPSVDVWAVGCILAELMRGKPLFPGRSELEQISVIFGVLGTPTDTNWPQWRTMPDANKLLFEPKIATSNWSELLNCRQLPIELENFLRLHLQLCSDFRPSANVLHKHSWLRPKGIGIGDDIEPPNYRINTKLMERKKKDALPPLHMFL